MPAVLAFDEEVFHIDNDDATTGSFLFTDHNKRISFWRSNEHFYLVNSHAVGNTSGCDDNDVKAAHLFECNSQASSSELLSLDCSYSGGFNALNGVFFYIK